MSFLQQHVCEICGKSYAQVMIIRREKPGIINKILRLEQEGEHLHAVINRIERNLTMTLNKSTRYWQVLRDYENKLYSGLK